MATTSLVKIKKMAERYEALKSEVEQIDVEYETKVKDKKEELESLKFQLIEAFKATGQPSVRTESDKLISYIKKPSVVVTNELFAYKWALENKAVRVDMKLASQMIKEMNDVPKGFDVVSSDYLQVTDKKKKLDKKNE